jgi:prevent-host-death family protein
MLSRGDDMIEQQAATRTMKISDVKARLSSLVNEVYRQKTRVLVEKAGIPVAGLVSVQDLQRLAELDEEQAERRRVLESMREPFRGIPAEEIEREAAKAVPEVRAEMAAERERRFAVIDQMREAFKDVPPEEIERNVVAIIREMRQANEVASAPEGQVAVERRPA